MVGLACYSDPLISGSPYCLRRDSTALRNMRDYTGVSASRLEVLEERLRSDVIAELDAFQGRVLLHTESQDGEVMPVWESVDKTDVVSIREVMDEAANDSRDVNLSFVRIPVTSESSPDVSLRAFGFFPWLTVVPRLDRNLGPVHANRSGHDGRSAQRSAWTRSQLDNCSDRAPHPAVAQEGPRA